MKRRFGLRAERELAPARGDGATCLVQDIAASSFYDGRGLVYRTGRFTYDRDFYHEYFAPPASIVTAELRRWLRRSGLFGSVVAPGSYIDAGYSLEGEIVALHGDYSEPVAAAVVSLNIIFLRCSTTGEAELCFQREFRAETPLSDDSADRLVDGLQESLGRVLTEIEAAVRAVLLEPSRG